MSAKIEIKVAIERVDPASPRYVVVRPSLSWSDAAGVLDASTSLIAGDNDFDLDNIGLSGPSLYYRLLVVTDGSGAPSIDTISVDACADPVDSDGAGAGDLCEDDDDDDLVPDDSDLCPLLADPFQGDLDSDLIGDLCDPDRDATAWMTRSTSARKSLIRSRWTSTKTGSETPATRMPTGTRSWTASISAPGPSIPRRTTSTGMVPGTSVTSTQTGTRWTTPWTSALACLTRSRGPWTAI